MTPAPVAATCSWRSGVAIVAVGGYAGTSCTTVRAARGRGRRAAVLAAAAGVAAFFSPCSSPLLARHTGADQPTATRVRRAPLFATSLSVGAVAFVLAVGVLFAVLRTTATVRQEGAGTARSIADPHSSRAAPAPPM